MLIKVFIITDIFIVVSLSLTHFFDCGLMVAMSSEKSLATSSFEIETLSENQQPSGFGGYAAG